MTTIRRLLPFPIRPLGLMTTAVMAAMLVGPTAQAFEVGHSRLLSVAGEPLRITIPLTQLSENDIHSLRVSAADLPAWKAAQLSPPVDLASLQFTVNAGQTKNTRLIRVSSTQVFNQAIADLLIDIHTAQGSKRHQVSLLAHDGGQAFASRKKTAAALDESDQEVASTPRTSTDNTSLIIVRPGDSMTAIAQRHAVDGFSMYQLMMALQRANPDAFINNNVNLVKAGSRLTMPDSKALAAISDREARRLFHQHLLAH